MVREMRYLHGLLAVNPGRSELEGGVHEEGALDERVVMHLDPANVAA